MARTSPRFRTACTDIINWDGVGRAHSSLKESKRRYQYRKAAAERHAGGGIRHYSRRHTTAIREHYDRNYTMAGTRGVQRLGLKTVHALCPGL